MKILIIDDDLTHVELMTIKIEQEDLGDVIIAPSGEEGLHLAIKEKPDLIILDTVLHGGMDGFETCRALRNIKNFHSKIIMITGKIDAIDVNHAVECGIDDYCVKTSCYENLITTVKNVIKRTPSLIIDENENVLQDDLLQNTIETLSTQDRKTVLVVDDILTNRLLLREILEMDNNKVLEADNGLNAIKVLQVKSKIDLIILDLDMPHMNGFSFAEVVKADNKYKHIPIILVTAEEDSNKVRHLNYYAYLRKPIDPESFLNQVKNAFEGGK